MRTCKNTVGLKCDVFMWRIIFHIDMDAFYASVEESKHPEYRGKPVIVGADPKEGRGVVLTANYEARKYGIKSGMPISRAYKLCPHAIYVKPNFDVYGSVSKALMDHLRKYAWKMEVVSIDEAYLDVTGIVNNYAEAEKLAKKIQESIWSKFRITCSIGIAPNKFLAKMASRVNKPSGITIVHPKDVNKFLNPLPVEMLHGVGRKTAEKLHQMGIHTVEELAKYDIIELISVFGKYGIYLHNIANGIDEREVSPDRKMKSMGEECTFNKDVDNIDKIMDVLKELSKSLFEKIKKRNLGFRTVTIKLRYNNFETLTRSKTLSATISDYRQFFKVVSSLFSKTHERNRKVRLIGVRVSNFVDTSMQKTLVEFFK